MSHDFIMRPEADDNLGVTMTTVSYGVPEPLGDGHHSSEALEAIAGDRLEATPP